MYSPEIKSDLVKALYRIGKERGRPMTSLVNEIISDWIYGQERETKQKEAENGRTVNARGR